MVSLSRWEKNKAFLFFYSYHLPNKTCFKHSLHLLTHYVFIVLLESGLVFILISKEPPTWFNWWYDIFLPEFKPFWSDWPSCSQTWVLLRSYKCITGFSGLLRLYLSEFIGVHSLHLTTISKRCKKMYLVQRNDLFY